MCENVTFHMVFFTWFFHMVCLKNSFEKHVKTLCERDNMFHMDFHMPLTGQFSHAYEIFDEISVKTA